MLASTINLNKCYQLLGIRHGASLDELKTSYRSLARQWHPDLNPGNIEAPQHFIALNQAYQILRARISSPSPQFSARAAVSTRSPHRTTDRTTHRVPQPATPTPKLSKHQAQLKWQLACELQSLVQQQQFLKAIFIVEGLAQHLPHDPQICQWEGIIYSKFGCQLVKHRQFNQARIYFNKALTADPHNQQLATIVNLAFNRMALLS